MSHQRWISNSIRQGRHDVMVSEQLQQEYHEVGDEEVFNYSYAARTCMRIIPLQEGNSEKEDRFSPEENKFLGRIDNASTATSDGNASRSQALQKGIPTSIHVQSLMLVGVVWESSGFRRHGTIACLLQILWLAGIRLGCPGAIRYDCLLDANRDYRYCLALATRAPEPPYRVVCCAYGFLLPVRPTAFQSTLRSPTLPSGRPQQKILVPSQAHNKQSQA